MRIAVTGAAGFVGGAIVEQAVTSGLKVRAIVRDTHPAGHADEYVACGDLLTADPVPLVHGCEAVIHCAARVHRTRREDRAAGVSSYKSMNVDLPVRLAKAARAHGVRNFVQISSVAALASSTPVGMVYGDHTQPRPATPYGKSKLAADEALLALATNEFVVTCLRPPAVIGPGVGAWFALLLKAAARGLPLPLGSIDNRRNFIAVENLADAALTAATAETSGAFIVTDSQPVSTGELYRRLLKGFGFRDRVWNWPAAPVRLAAAAALGRRSESLLGNAAFDGTRFAHQFDWSPPVAFERSLEGTIAGSRC
ncbi:NAD-dependent epimerase/dehydratase family protein [Altererythrobacter aurantiacus]|uniref:NAD-dependent epimerase/dehydratase family protein n=1 Tax=Parapontixanthobacter aurantiacus TaxID=1463599 RepID=A0A844ZI31_9SPHN|nr:NAD-dependent epimerase/dehydratase family protein [Parapontixanthobacter aurantiacus]MXO86776.1 NAD-dependent epimerase/dehydratase family protein [Parapontixanthobacter aurantiacus]